MWAGKESNLLCGSIDFGLCQFQYIYLVRALPSPHIAHLTKNLPNAFIIFRDLVKLNKLIHPKTHW